MDNAAILPMYYFLANVIMLAGFLLYQIGRKAEE